MLIERSFSVKLIFVEKKRSLLSQKINRKVVEGYEEGKKMIDLA